MAQEKIDYNALRACSNCVHSALESPGSVGEGRIVCVKEPPQSQGVFMSAVGKNGQPDPHGTPRFWYESFYPVPSMPCSHFKNKHYPAVDNAVRGAMLVAGS